MRSRTFFVIVLCSIGTLGGHDAAGDASVAPSARPSGVVTARAQQLWRGLPKSQERCGEFDYFPDGGMRNFYCHLLSETSWSELQKLAPMPVFSSGPHTAEKLVLDSPTDFGRYNPEFVRWLGDAFLPAAGDEQFRAATKPIYDRYVRTLARTFFASHEALRRKPSFLAKEKRALLSAIARQKGDEISYEKYYDYTGGGYDGNVSKTAVAFWIRRSIDGTDGDFFADLTHLLREYDPAFLKNNH